MSIYWNSPERDAFTTRLWAAVEAEEGFPDFLELSPNDYALYTSGRLIVPSGIATFKDLDVYLNDELGDGVVKFVRLEPVESYRKF